MTDVASTRRLALSRAFGLAAVVATALAWWAPLPLAAGATPPPSRGQAATPELPPVAPTAPGPPPIGRGKALPPGWTRLQVPLPDFELHDTSGRSWRLADLRGKRTMVFVWATWCGFCRQELPLVEELHRRIAGRTGLGVVTLNIDRDRSRVGAFLRDGGYTFPSLLGLDWFTRLGTDGSIPRSWIVDADGVVRFEQRGFAVQRAGVWVDEVLGLLEGPPAATGPAR